MKNLLGISMVSLMALVLLVYPVVDAGSEPAIVYKVGDIISDGLKASTLDGAQVALKKSLNTPYTVFQFMTTACSACQAELQELIKLQAEIGSEKLSIIPISMDMLGADAVRAYENRFRYGLTYLLDTGFTIPPKFNFAYTPSFFVVDKGGNVVFMKGGFMLSRWGKVKDQLKTIIK